MVGGRSYNQSQFNRAVSASRQPGSVFKPFVFLAAFERAAEEGLQPDTRDAGQRRTDDLRCERDAVEPRQLRGRIRRGDHVEACPRDVAQCCDRKGGGKSRVSIASPISGGGSEQERRLAGFPSIALGVFEATPLDIATAYTVFANRRREAQPEAALRINRGGKEIVAKEASTKRVARADTTYLVTNMMRSVLSEGTGASVRASGFSLDAAGKTGTTNDLRDAWFVGFTPELLTVVWVGLDDNQALGLSGAQAALPIWIAFMQRALAGHADRAFDVPDNISFVDIDRDTGATASPDACGSSASRSSSEQNRRSACEVHGI